MSYCIAWKKNEQVFMLSESAISSFEDDIQAGISTFGEVQGLYGKYYVQEGLLKIIKINDDFVLGVSGDVPTIIELLTHVYSLREMLTLEIKTEGSVRSWWKKVGILKFICLRRTVFPVQTDARLEPEEKMLFFLQISIK